MNRTFLLSLLFLLLPTTACHSTSNASATTEASAAKASYDRPGFVTFVKEGRLWIFRAGSKELGDYLKQGAPAQSVTRIGTGPDGMTLKAIDAATIDAWLAAK